MMISFASFITLHISPSAVMNGDAFAPSEDLTFVAGTKEHL